MSVFLRSRDRLEETILRFLFSYNLSPKSWIYFAIYEFCASLAGNEYFALVKVSNGSESTTAYTEWRVNKYWHTIDILYFEEGETRNLQLYGSDRITDY
jgi:hypothetical protein